MTPKPRKKKQLNMKTRFTFFGIVAPDQNRSNGKRTKTSDPLFKLQPAK
jgi:hypothetical protein